MAVGESHMLAAYLGSQATTVLVGGGQSTSWNSECVRPGDESAVSSERLVMHGDGECAAYTGIGRDSHDALVPAQLRRLPRC